MADGERLKVILAWHMHQPQYRDLISGEYQLPWVYLHVLKDYVDMAAHLEAHPNARAVVNFAPILLEQIADYAAQVSGFLENSRAIRDDVLCALTQVALPVDPEARLPLIKACLRANETRMIARFPAYQHLAEMARWLIEHPSSSVYLSEQFLVDLVVWHHLAWLGETVRRSDARVRRLIEKAGGYTLHDRRELLTVIGELLAGVIGRYRRLAERGQVELSTTPYAHPILPLLVDLKSAHDAQPDAPLPLLERYPDGVERARWHVRRGIDTFAQHFGFAPTGCWPAEGGVSDAALDLLAESGFRWAATGEGVLRHTLARAGENIHGAKDGWLYRRHATAKGVSAFFRDDGLSDLIGFTYATWHADDAVANLVHHLESIAEHAKDHPERVVSIILDGENAWEHYPENGYYFLNGLYARLAEHPRIRLTTFQDCLGLEPRTLPPLVAGSWVYGTFSTWIGDRDKNRGWDMLTDAARAFQAARSRLKPETLARAEVQLAVCEGSDWFWWFGDYNPAATVSDFERLYRDHLANLYQLIGVEPPDYLSAVFTRGSGMPVHGGTMRPGQPTA
ncbi:glycoside hydrolase [Sulfurifustis variabilis]|uniref:Glycoside hydrolase n=1 Tax=Sulfurifustis variabilis TaxID=1675686 RepID=A0A1B4V554_9GAMM|nr:glycoside hydrolase family 57 protein [Sulfurifustis variabilis]BAU48669.1 glycoside hydrolase [Sulfurifustis variabilis]